MTHYDLRYVIPIERRFITMVISGIYTNSGLTQLRKRLYQLTGILIPDAKLAAANTAKHILTLATRDPKPLKLAQMLEKRNAFNDLSNVKLHERKIGPIDKEVAVGRWKVIEEELKKRDLPVTGYGNAARNKERDWLTGKI